MMSSARWWVSRYRWAVAAGVGQVVTLMIVIDTPDWSTRALAVAMGSLLCAYLLAKHEDHIELEDARIRAVGQRLAGYDEHKCPDWYSQAQLRTEMMDKTRQVRILNNKVIIVANSSLIGAKADAHKNQTSNP